MRLSVDQRTDHIRWPDIAKGIGIILVVFGHGMFPIHSLIDSFHIPLFFMLAGLFLNLHKYSIVEYSINRFTRVILPLCIYVILIGFYAMPMGKEEIMHHLSSLWFLYTIFVAAVLYFAVRKLISLRVTNSLFLLMLILLHITYKGGGSIPILILVRILFAMLFIHLGNLYMTKCQKIDSNWLVVLALVGFCYCNYTILVSYNGLNISYYTCSLFELPFITFWCVTLTGSYLVIRLSKIIGKCNILEFLGRNTLAVYAIHIPIIWKLNNFISSLPHFELSLYKMLYAGAEYLFVFTIVICLIKIVPRKCCNYLGISK